jgi:hypothetical protein
MSERTGYMPQCPMRRRGSGPRPEAKGRPPGRRSVAAAAEAGVDELLNLLMKNECRPTKEGAGRHSRRKRIGSGAQVVQAAFGAKLPPSALHCLAVMSLKP